jgi:hypothetical protein
MRKIAISVLALVALTIVLSCTLYVTAADDTESPISYQRWTGVNR